MFPKETVYVKMFVLHLQYKK